MTTLNQAFKSFNVRRATEAALNNEQKTRERVERLEFQGVDKSERLKRLERFVRAGFWARMRWLFRGC